MRRIEAWDSHSSETQEIKSQHGDERKKKLVKTDLPKLLLLPHPVSSISQVWSRAQISSTRIGSWQIGNVEKSKSRRRKHFHYQSPWIWWLCLLFPHVPLFLALVLEFTGTRVLVLELNIAKFQWCCGSVTCRLPLWCSKKTLRLSKWWALPLYLRIINW